MNDAFYTPNCAPAPLRQRIPGERLFAFLCGHDRYHVELRDHGRYGGEAQFWQNEEFSYSRRFETRGKCAAGPLDDFADPSIDCPRGHRAIFTWVLQCLSMAGPWFERSQTAALIWRRDQVFAPPTWAPVVRYIVSIRIGPT